MHKTHTQHDYILGESKITLHIDSHQGTEQQTNSSLIHPCIIFNCLPQKHISSIEYILNDFEFIISLSPMNNNVIIFYFKNIKYSISPLNVFSKTDIQKHLGKNIEIELLNKLLIFGRWLMGYLCAKEIYVLTEIIINKNPSIITTSRKTHDLATIAGLKSNFIDPYSNTVKYKDSILTLICSKGLDFTEIQCRKNNIRFTTQYLIFLHNLTAYLKHGKHKPKKTWNILKSGDAIDLIAISSQYNPLIIKIIKNILKKHNLNVYDRFAKQHTNSLEYANSDKYRSQQLYNALSATDSSAIWAINGGSGSSRIISDLLTQHPPLFNQFVKPIIGYSDTTGLHLSMNTLLDWPSIHGPLASYNSNTTPHIHNWTNCEEPITSIIDILKGNVNNNILNYQGIQPLNSAAKNTVNIKSTLLGGNMTLVCNLASTPFIPFNKTHILILEDVGISPRQTERFLDQLRYGTICQNSKAILLGEFIETKNPTILQKKNMEIVLLRFAKKTTIPVFLWPFFGHGKKNNPLPLNTQAYLLANEKGIFSLKIHTK